MKHLATLATICLLLTCSFSARADENKQRPSQEQIVEYQCKELVSVLKLDDAKVKEFTDTYKSYRDELKATRDKYGKTGRKKRSEMTDDEIEQFRDVLYTLRHDELLAWQQSVKKRGITLPATINDEFIMLYNETTPPPAHAIKDKNQR